MATRYTELFRIQCRHDFFADGLCHMLELTPTAACLRQLERYGGLFRKIPGGGVICFDQRDLLRLFDETTPFAFALTGPGAAISGCTDMGTAPATSPAAGLFYFGNLGTGETLLHPPGDPFAGGALPVLSRRSAPRAETLSDMLGNQLPANLGTLPEGRYRWPDDGGDFYLSDVSPAARWGVAEIFPPKAPAAFAIALTARQSYWRYHIVSQSAVDRAYGDFRITGIPAAGATGSPVAFAAPVQEQIGGKTAWMFESSAPIALRQYPGDHYAFTLVRSGAENGIALPYGDPATTRLIQDAGGARVCSEIFVYL